MTTLKVETLNGGQRLVLDHSQFLAEGTEGEIYRLPGDDSLVIKIYKDKDKDERVDKLKAMVARSPDDPMRDKGHASIAWPTDLVLWTGNNEVCGFVMPRLGSSHPISRFYDLDERRKHLPFFTYRSLCRLGANLASAVWAIHEKGYVIGDINDRNVMATDGALVTLVDTDSFQIKEQDTGRLYRCTVWSQDYTPPELQGAHFDQIERSPEHDLFGIGVLLFQLLMEGRLPFVCAFKNPNDGVDAIRCLIRGYFPYGQSRNGIIPPPVAPPYAMLHPALQKLFNQCFIDGFQDPQMRPPAEVWHRTLRDTEQELVECRANSQHYYFNHLQKCPWCERAQFLNAGQKRRNLDPFPQPGSVSAGPRPRSVRSGTQRSIPSAAPPPRPAVGPTVPQSPVVFTASATSITPGQSITFKWTVPNASIVQLKEGSRRIVSTSYSPDGSATVWPTKSKTYQLAAPGISVTLPPPISVSVAQPVPVDLKEIAVELHEPIALHSTQLPLLQTLLLKQPATPLLSPMLLKEHMHLDGYLPLNDVTVELNYAAPVG